MASMISVAIVDYGMGNVRSVLNAFELLGAKCSVTQDRAELSSASHLVLPGVGAFPDGMRNLKKRGLDQLLTELVVGQGKPVLGICLGMQLFASRGFEVEQTPGLDWVKGDVIQLSPEPASLKIPHVGWNDFESVVPQPDLKLDTKDCFYYVHSFHLSCADKENVIATCNYGQSFASVVRTKNIVGTQFHPEKSQHCGLHLLKEFMNLIPSDNALYA